MSTWIGIATSWTLVSLIVGLGGYYYYTTSQPPSTRRSSLSQALPSNGTKTENTKKDKPKKTKTKQVFEQAKEIIDTAKQAVKEAVPSAGLVTGADVPVNPAKQSGKKHKKNISDDDKTFAQALQKQQVGTTFSGERAKHKVRTQKQGKAVEKDEVVMHVGGGAAQKVTNSKNEVVEPYGDAVTNDEPISPISPTETETPVETPGTETSESFPSLHASHGGFSGVDDMLEPDAPGPSVLRMTAPTEEWSTVTKKKFRPNNNTNNSTTNNSSSHTTTTATRSAGEETKKQRQARQKREAEKAAIAQSEAVRKQLEEKQRRTAREARGEPAKNGESVAKASVWKGGANGSVGQNQNQNRQQALFDTFETEAPLMDRRN